MPESQPEIPVYPTEPVRLDELRPHPRNYKTHPDDQVKHLMQSVREADLDWDAIEAQGTNEYGLRPVQTKDDVSSEILRKILEDAQRDP